MKPYLLKIPLQRKEPELRFDTCQIDHVHVLSEQVFHSFQRNLMNDYDFLREYNREYAGEPAQGVRNGVLILNNGSDDGIFVCTEGADYARYSAYVPNARQLLLMKEYPILQSYCASMAETVDHIIQKAMNTGLPEPYRFSLRELDDATMYNRFHDELFLDMLDARPEVADIDIDRDEVLLTIAPEYLPQRNQALRTLSEDEIKVACAKHLLWCYDAGGEQADFSGCAFENVDFSGMELNSAIFDGAVFRNCNLSDASLCFASCKGCTFVNCDCHDLTAEEACFKEAVFSSCNLNRAILTHSDFTRAILQDSSLENSSLQNCLLNDTQFEDTKLGRTNLNGASEDGQSWFQEAPAYLSMEELQ